MTDSSRSSPPAVIAPDGHIAGRYRLVRRLARGGMAEVWEAVDDVLDRPVAVKILLPHLAADEAFVTRFRREAVAAAGLSDPHIVSIYDTCAGGGLEAIVMELVQGRTLRQVLDEEGSVPPARAVSVAVQVARALEHSHSRGLVHRDIKPGNILLSGDGRVLVTDFGIAKAAEGALDLTEAGQVVGTAKYLAPEQVRGGPVDPRTDIYSLGVVLFEMLCGRAPFTGENSTATAMARLHGEAPAPRRVCPWLPPDLDLVVRRCLALDPDERFATAAAVRGALTAADLGPGDPDATGAVPVAHPPDDGADAHAMGDGAWPGVDDTPAAGIRLPDRRRRWPAPVGLVAVVLGTLALVWWLVGGTDLGRDLLDTGGQGGSAAEDDTPPTVARLAAFDPAGDGSEHDDELGRLVDGDTTTHWRTESYYDGLQALKPGVGVVIHLQQPATVDELQVHSPNETWSAEIYLTDDVIPGNLDGWGEPVARRERMSGTTSFDLGGRQATAVLVWFTAVGEGPDDGALRVTELSLR